MPAFNAENHIYSAVGSVLNQTFSNLEVIVVNDGSTDQTASVLASISDPRLKVFTQGNRGQCAAANEAFRHSSGEYIKFFDADDLLNPEFIENQIRLIDGSQTLLASASWGRFYNDDVSTFKLNPESVWKDAEPADWLVESLRDGPNMMQCGLWLIPRQVLEKSGLWDERLSLINDFDFIIRVILASEGIRFSERSTLYYRSGDPSSLSAKKSRKAMESAWLSVDLGCAHILKVRNDNEARRVCANVYATWMYQFYPEHPDLVGNCEAKIKELGGHYLELPGGRLTHLLNKVLPWKRVADIKQLKRDKSRNI